MIAYTVLRPSAALVTPMTTTGLSELFEALARALGESAKLNAGNYEFSNPLTPLSLLQQMTRGDVTLLAVTFVEGSTFKQMRKAMQDNPKTNVKHGPYPDQA